MEEEGEAGEGISEEREGRMNHGGETEEGVGTWRGDVGG